MSGVTSVTGRNCAMLHSEARWGSRFVLFETAVCYFGKPSSIGIPSTVREIGESAFALFDSLREMNFEEGVERIRKKAFYRCVFLVTVNFPASLTVIDEDAFRDCFTMRKATFAAGFRLQTIHATEIDPSAFDPALWHNVSFDGPSQLLIGDDFLRSADSMVLLACFSSPTVVIPVKLK
jgi:hypothetical protein